MNCFPLVGVLDKTMTSEVQFDSLVHHAMGQPILVLAEIEKVPDLQKTSTISSYFRHSYTLLLALLLRVPATS